MLNFSKFMTENYKNFIGPNSNIDREKWVDQAWDILQKSYSPIGGVKGTGFSSKQDMIDNIPFWKLFIRNGKVIVGVYYKDKGGRKAVAISSDGSEESKKIISKIYLADIGVSYGEKSGAALGLVMKIADWDTLEKFMLTPKQVEKITGEKTIPISEYGIDNLDNKDKITYTKFPQLKYFFYVRKIAGEMHLKVSFGTPNIPIL